jgi:hypothetical protein
MASQLEEIKRVRLSEIDDLLDLYNGKISLDDILNQDYSFISDLANVRNDKNLERLAEAKNAIPPSSDTFLDKVAGKQSGDKREKTKPSSSSRKKTSV